MGLQYPFWGGGIPQITSWWSLKEYIGHNKGDWDSLQKNVCIFVKNICDIPNLISRWEKVTNDSSRSLNYYLGHSKCDWGPGSPFKKCTYFYKTYKYFFNYVCVCVYTYIKEICGVPNLILGWGNQIASRGPPNDYLGCNKSGWGPNSP